MSKKTLSNAQFLSFLFKTKLRDLPADLVSKKAGAAEKPSIRAISDTRFKRSQRLNRPQKKRPANME